jgi:hypothetical protein
MSQSEKELKNQHLILKNIFKPIEKGSSNTLYDNDICPSGNQLIKMDH